MKHCTKVQKRILGLVFTLLLAASLSLGIGAGEARAEGPVSVSSWSGLEDAVKNDGVIRLDNDVKAEASDYQIFVDGKDVILDLNGHTIDRNLTEASDGGHVFILCNNATLTIRDDSAGKTGKITGAWNKNDNGGCIEVRSGCTLKLEGGSIEGNKNVAKATDGTNLSRAGGIYNAGTFNMTGGRIAGNGAGYGAGVLVFDDATFTMTGGEITGNSCSGGDVDKGAGVYAYKGASVTLGGGARITGNTGSTGNASNLYIGSYYGPYAINLSDTALTGNARIGVSTAATDTVAITTAGKDKAAFFTADDSADFAISTNSSDNCIYLEKKGPSFINSTQPGSNACSPALSGTTDQLMEQLLSADDRSAIAAGTMNVRVALTVGEDVPADDQGKIEAAKGNAQIGRYLDLKLEKSTDGITWDLISETVAPVTITLRVPDELINSDGSVTRTYQIIRLHGGAVNVLPCDYDSATGTVSFQTDRFSSYALAYTDTLSGSSESGSSESGGTESSGSEDDDSEDDDSGDGGSEAVSTPQLDEVPKTGSSDKAAIFLTLGLISGMGAVILRRGSYRKENSHCE